MFLGAHLETNNVYSRGNTDSILTRKIYAEGLLLCQSHAYNIYNSNVEIATKGNAISRFLAYASAKKLYYDVLCILEMHNRVHCVNGNL